MKNPWAAEHQTGIQHMNNILTKIKRRKAKHDSMVRDAERYRFIRDADKSDELTPELALYAMEALDDYVDEAMREYEKRHNDRIQPRR